MSERHPPSERSLQEAAASLPRSIQPEHDLWPAIEARIAARRARPVRWWPAGLAAVAAAAFVSIVVNLTPSPSAPARAGLPAEALAEIRAAEAEYVRAAERLSEVLASHR